jgi:drug/metabolite transporter (DMT)-like permease
MNRQRLLSFLQVIAAAILFGASAPFAKLLLGDVQPVMLAGLLYFGSGLGLALFSGMRLLVKKREIAEAPLAGQDFAWLAGAVLAGAITAPILLLVSLKNTPASTASLLLNFEAVAATFIAWLVFREAVGMRALAAILLITLAGVLLSLDTSQQWGVSLGAVGIMAACFLWGIDNNFTRNISSKDAVITTMIKGLAGGTFSIMLAFSMGNILPPLGTLLEALALGCLSYGVSIVLFIQALRGLGAARTSALFSFSPLAGIILSFVLLHEQPAWMFYLTLSILAAGAYLLVSESHVHPHHHHALVHQHAHSHTDGHHAHAHPGGVAGRHSHVHTHEELEHAHDHLPDLHHRHTH